ncbi:N1R/p28 family protein [Fowlpox virus]|uniref:N1R/p28 family protein n=1 Tax=Fowlpox virus TaxID=10261 RepID=A0A7G0WT53_FOWPV|nr:N1R/p28 family protein [Fowlpox virus]
MLHLHLNNGDTEYRVIEDNGFSIILLKHTEYINVTKLCKIHNKEFYRWKRLISAGRIIETVSRDISNQGFESPLVYVNRKGNKEFYGFYAHPQLALYIAKWISEDIFNKIKHLINSYTISDKTVVIKDFSYCDELCPDAIIGKCCKTKSSCEYVHGDICDICGFEALHPTDIDKRLTHEKVCMQLLCKEDIKYDKCGICLDAIKGNKKPYGILSDCNHMFCINCIKTWMTTINSKKQCPECRVPSKYIIQSPIWTVDKVSKNQLSVSYKTVYIKSC